MEVSTLLEASQPRPQVPRGWYLLGGLVLFVGWAAIAQARSPGLGAAIEVSSILLTIGLIGAMSAMTLSAVRRFRLEQQQVEAAGELLQLRRWPEAAVILEHYLSHPARTNQLRAQALVYLTSVLTRYHRFEDAIAVQDHLLKSEPLDGPTTYALRVGRTMAMLRQDHLFDADRAISELRRLVPDGKESSGLALVELYRDVKTGHPVEAIDLFNQRLAIMRDQLGHRLADAYALVARAYDLLNRSSEAQSHWEKATLLAPPAELYRRYPELQKLQDRYQPSTAPPEAA